MLGFRFDIIPSGIPETTDEDLTPSDHVLLLSQQKARAVAANAERGIVIGADTIVDLEGEILEKPVDRENAVSMLERLSGKTHRVHTAVTLVDAADDRELSDVAETSVTFRSIPPSEIQRYVEAGESMDKAGAYAAQGRAATFIESVSGCFYNVVGLPLSLVWSMMEQMIGASPSTLIASEISSDR